MIFGWNDMIAINRMELVTRREKRKLTEQEIADLVGFIKPFRVNPLLPADDAAIAIADTQRHGFVRQLRNVLVYPQILRPLRDSLEIAYKRALIDAGKSVGALASTSIGEKNTQQSLSCVDWNERVLIIHKGRCIEDNIGRIIDDIIDNNKVVFRDPYVEQDPNILKPVGNGYIESRDVNDMWIPAVDEKGKMAWRKVETVMRHPLYNRLLKVQLRSGRSVMGTSAKSFLTRRDNKIVAIAGSDLKIGDRLPINVRAPLFQVQKYLDLREILSPTKYIFGSELWKCRKIRDEYISKGNRLWWKVNNGIKFIIPYTEPDTAMDGLEGKKKCKVGREDIKENCVYTLHRTKHLSHITEKLPLTAEFGFFIGSYLAEGCVTKNYISIANYHQGFLDRIQRFVEIYNIGSHRVSIGYKYKYFNSIAPETSEKEKLMEECKDSAEIRIHSLLLADIIEKTCGKHSINKHVPYFAYTAPDEFISGLLDGYFSGDGTVHEIKGISATSISLHLLQGISWLLTRFDIHSKIRSDPNPGSRIFRGRECKIQQAFSLKISCKNVCRFAKHIPLIIEYKQKRIDNLARLDHLFTYSLYDKIGGINIPNIPTEIHRDKLLKYSDEFKSLVDCDVLFDEIIAIEDVDPSHDYVYDFTVEGTRTFGLLSGVQVNDSFHSAGQQKIALLVGVPRMEELVNVTRDIKTPSMEIWLDYPEEKLRNLSFVREKAFEWLQMREVIDFIVDYNISQNREITENERKWYRMHSIFVGEHYENCEWSIRLEFNPKLLYQNRMTLSIVVKTIHDNYGDAHCVMSPDNVGIVDVYVDTDELGEVKKVIKSLKDNRRKSKKKHEEDDDADLRLLITDENKEYYFLRDLVLPSILHLQVGGIHGIKQCFFQETNGLWYVTTNGSNLKAVLSLPVVNGCKTITNHLWDTFELLGSEASRQLLRREFEKVIGVGHRHIELLIDSMTSSGRPQPASSRGINIKDVGLLAKISFEHAWEHFFKGAMVAETDKIRGAASSIVAGNVPPTGSGYMGILDAKSELPIDEDAELYNHAVVMSSRSAVSQGHNSLKTSQPVNIEIPGGITRRKITRPSALSKHVAPSPFTPSPGDAGRPRGRSRMMGIPLMPSLLDDTGKEELRRMKPVKSDLFKNSGRVTENEAEIY
jgi:intein/homing endonuclease